MFKNILFAFVLAAVPCLSSVGHTSDREYEIKAAYIYNLVKFIEWPNTLANNHSEAGDFLICSFHHPALNNQIKQISGKSTGSSKISVRIIDAADGIPKNCKIIFIPSDYNKLMSVLELNSEGYSGILSVGENDDFIKNNGLIALIVDDNHIKLKINLKEAKQRKFKISGKLLEIAEIIE